MKSLIKLMATAIILTFFYSCGQSQGDINAASPTQNKTAADILGNPKYLAMSYGGYRQNTRDIQPTVEELKEDMKILSAMGVGIVRTYNLQLPEAANLLEAIHQLKKADSSFEMYVMLGAWINCKDAWTPTPNHDAEDEKGNAIEIAKAVELTNKYPDIVKVIAVGNESMVKWAASYFVQPGIILKWVNHLQDLKKTGKLVADTWITSSDNYAAWGGEGGEYHVEDLNKLIAAVDYLSVHIYPMHETHYKPEFWGVFEGEENKSDEEKIALAMKRAFDFGIAQYDRTAAYMKSLGIDKPIHIGETGWATSCNGFYGNDGTRATDEYKESIFYYLMRDWTKSKNMSCFYFEAFNENWKDSKNPGGSENYFGLFTIDGKAKYALWDLVDKGVFEGLARGGNPVVKTYNGDKAALMKEIKLPPFKSSSAVNKSK
jgi:exo-beta-1,3-glucanase (GH17 family)